MREEFLSICLCTNFEYEGTNPHCYISGYVDVISEKTVDFGSETAIETVVSYSKMEEHHKKLLADSHGYFVFNAIDSSYVFGNDHECEPEISKYGLIITVYKETETMLIISSCNYYSIFGIICDYAHDIGIDLNLNKFAGELVKNAAINSVEDIIEAIEISNF